MKKYRFPLRSVQTVREIREMNAREAFSAAMHGVSLAEGALNDVRLRISNLEQSMRSGRGALVRAAEQVAYIHEYEVQRENEKKALVELNKATELLNKRREAWILARRDVRVLENLETKSRQEYRREFEREEQSQLDDRTSALSGRAPLLMS
jgi:flagellar FliJ protein